MGLSFVAAGTSAPGTGSAAPDYPAGLLAGDKILLLVTSKYPPNVPDTPAGFALLGRYQGGAGASGVDAGQVFVSVFARDADGSEAGTINVTVPSGNVVLARTYAYRSSVAGAAIAAAAVGGSDNTGAGNWSATASSTIDLTVADVLVLMTGVNSDGPSFAAFTVTATGITFGAQTNRLGSQTTQGDDCQQTCRDAPVTAGTAVVAPVFTMSASGTTANAPAGATAFVRLREVVPATGTAAGAATTSADASAELGPAAGAAAGTATSSAIAGTAAVGASTGAASGLATAAGDSTAEVGGGVDGAAAGAATVTADASATVGPVTGGAAGTSTVWGFPPIAGLVADDPVIVGRVLADDVTIQGRLLAAEIEVTR